MSIISVLFYCEINFYYVFIKNISFIVVVFF